MSASVSASLAVVRAALEYARKATQGPYTASDYNPQVMGADGRRIAWIGTDGPGDRESPGANRRQLLTDAYSIAALHNAIGHIAAVCDELERLRAELVEEQASRARCDEHFKAVCAQRDTTSRLNEVIRKKLAKAKALGLEACEFAHSAIRNAPSSDSQDPGDLSAIFGGHENADRIAAELEKL